MSLMIRQEERGKALTDRGSKESEACQKPFDDLKMSMVMEPVLQLPEFDKPFSVETFASGRDLDGFPVGDAESEQGVVG